MNLSYSHVHLHRISLVPFRTFKGPLFSKPVTGQKLFLAVSYSKLALVVGFLQIWRVTLVSIRTKKPKRFLRDPKISLVFLIRTDRVYFVHTCLRTFGKMHPFTRSSRIHDDFEFKF